MIELNRENVRQVVKKKLNLKLYKLKNGHLRMKRKKYGLKDTKGLLQSTAIENFDQILFTDEKIFTVEQAFNRQNDRFGQKNSLVKIAGFVCTQLTYQPQYVHLSPSQLL